MGVWKAWRNGLLYAVCRFQGALEVYGGLVCSSTAPAASLVRAQTPRHVSVRQKAPKCIENRGNKVRQNPQCTQQANSPIKRGYHKSPKVQPPGAEMPQCESVEHGSASSTPGWPCVWIAKGQESPGLNSATSN